MNDMFGRNKLNKPLKVRCPFCKHTFPPEIIQIIGITEEPINFVILACPNAKPTISEDILLIDDCILSKTRSFGKVSLVTTLKAEFM